MQNRLAPAMESDMERSQSGIGSPLRTLASAASADDGDDEKALNLVQQHLSTVVRYRCIVLFERACT